MTTTLAIPKKIATHQPKPTKTQLIDALVERARLKFEADKEAQEQKLKKIEALIIEEALKVIGQGKSKEPSVRVWDFSTELHFTVKSKEIDRLSKLHNKTDVLRWFQEGATREEIKKQLATPNPLLGCDADTAKALDQLLERIMNIKPAIEA
jgi:hypothetical protein